MTRDQINIRLSNIDRWEDAARRGWFQRPARDLQESPKNFGFGFYGTWNSGLLLTEEPTYRILQSPLTAWWQVMTQCVTHGLDPAMVRDWLDQATGRHYADAPPRDSTGRRNRPLRVPGTLTAGPLQDQTESRSRAVHHRRPGVRVRGRRTHDRERRSPLEQATPDANPPERSSTSVPPLCGTTRIWPLGRHFLALPVSRPGAEWGRAATELCSAIFNGPAPVTLRTGCGTAPGRTARRELWRSWPSRSRAPSSACRA